MRILVLADIHSNLPALEAVLRQEPHADLLCCAGDLVDYGTAPAGVIAQLQGLAVPRHIVRGNHDAHALRTRSAAGFASLAPGEYKWIHHNCERMGEGDFAYLERLPETTAFEADGYAYLVRHQYDEGYGTIQSTTAFEAYWRRFAPEALWEHPRRRAVFGHTHRRGVHHLGDGCLWLNPGSVSYRRPDDDDKTAHYAVIDNGRIELRRTPYPREGLLAEAMRQKAAGRMMREEIEDFEFFFGDKPSTRRGGST